MTEINRDWHSKNKMSDCRDENEKMVWRIEHMKHCDCRKPSDKQLREIAEWERKKKR